MIEKICFHKRQDASGKTGVIGAHNNDQWLQERINSEAENNLGEIQSSEFIEMIEKREKNSHNFQNNHLGKFSSEHCAVEHCDDKYDAGNVNNVDMARDLTGKITGCMAEEAANDDTEEYVIMLSENSFLADNQQTDGRLSSGTNYGRIENTDEEASEELGAVCINTGNFSREDVGLQDDDEGSSSTEDDRGSVLTTKPAHTASQDPIEMRDNSSSHAEDDSERNSGRDDGGDTKRDDIARNDDGEKTSDCDDEKSEKSHTKTLETNESTTFNDQEQRNTSLSMADSLIPLKVRVKTFSTT